MADAMSCAECRGLLDAYHDGELMSDERAAVAEHTAACSECAQALETVATTSHLVGTSLMRYAAPDVLKARIRGAIANADSVGDEADRQALPRGRSRRMRLWAGAAGIAIASSAATLLVASRIGTSPGVREQTVAAEVLESHLRALLPGHLVDVASTNQHNVKPWFAGRVDLSPAVPNLDSAAFSLVGGRLDYVAGHRVAAVVYARRQHLIDVYSWTEAGADETPSTTTLRGYHAVYWRVGGVETWVISDLNSTELADFSTRYRHAEGVRE